MPQPNPTENISRELVVANKMGIHARPAAMFVKVASKFDADVFVEKDGERVNGKSIMGIMMLAAEPGSEIILIIEGSDEQNAFEALSELIDNKFYEEG